MADTSDFYQGIPRIGIYKACTMRLEPKDTEPGIHSSEDTPSVARWNGLTCRMSIYHHTSLRVILLASQLMVFAKET